MDEELSRLGLTLVENFISPEEESLLLESLPKNKKSPQKKTRNNIWRYGERKVYTDGFVSKEAPPLLVELSQRLKDNLGYRAAPKCFTINEYHEGQSIEPHVDQLACGPVITVLSLLSTATMRFSGGSRLFLVELPPRSLVIMRGDIRTSWQHSIDPVASTRYSVVFRQ
jgi:alkylated DNA repair dioxygenase AlkB